MTLGEFESLRLGINEIDAEHWEMFAVLGRVLQNVQLNDYTGVNSALETLSSEFNSHAEKEISIMREMNFPFIETHIVAHSILFSMLEREIKNALMSNYQNLTSSVEHILIDHIMQYDVLYAEYAKHITPHSELL